MSPQAILVNIRKKEKKMAKKAQILHFFVFFAAAHAVFRAVKPICLKPVMIFNKTSDYIKSSIVISHLFRILL